MRRSDVSCLSDRGHQERPPSGAGEGGAEETADGGEDGRRSPGGRLQTTQVHLIS